MDEINIWRTAKVLIDAHGPKAASEAAWRAEKAVEDGNAEAEAVWKRVGQAIAELSRTTSTGALH